MSEKVQQCKKAWNQIEFGVQTGAWNAEYSCPVKKSEPYFDTIFTDGNDSDTIKKQFEDAGCCGNCNHSLTNQILNLPYTIYRMAYFLFAVLNYTPVCTRISHKESYELSMLMQRSVWKL